MPERKVAPITQARMKDAALVRQQWAADVEYGVTLEDIQDPAYWSMMGMYMKPYDLIEARAEDGSWIAFLIVTGCDRTWAKVAVDRVVNLTTSDVALSQVAPKHKVDWKGPHRKYSVIRLSDSENVHDGFQSREEAYSWMRDHEKVVG